jgi:1-acyl-sn-glycerol-3-phosphate acyltransferase
VLYEALEAVLVGPAMHVIYRPRVEGVEHVPRTGPAILASNHLSFSDSMFLPLVAPRRVVFIAKAEYFTGTGLRGRVTAEFFRALGTIPVDRTGGRAALAAVETGRRVLEAGDLLGMYPEGTRSPDGRLYRFRTGVARLAIDTGVPVIPCALVGTDRVQPPGARMWRLGRPSVLFGEPLDFSSYAGRRVTTAALRSVTEDIRSAVQKLSAQDYVDVYASTVKGGEDTDPA